MDKYANLRKARAVYIVLRKPFTTMPDHIKYDLKEHCPAILVDRACQVLNSFQNHLKTVLGARGAH